MNLKANDSYIGGFMNFFKKTDWIIILVLLILGGGGLLFYYLRPAGNNLTAEIYYDSEKLATIPLDTAEAESFSLTGHENVTFRLDGAGGISFESSDCPDKVCVHSGTLNKHGQSAACLPNRLIIRVVSPKGGSVDYVA